jgi:hypothetical protein
LLSKLFTYFAISPIHAYQRREKKTQKTMRTHNQVPALYTLTVFREVLIKNGKSWSRENPNLQSLS